LPSQQEIADAAADEVGFVTMLVQPIKHLQSIWIDLTARDWMLCARDQNRLDHGWIVPNRADSAGRTAVLESVVAMGSDT
jgi:hypothetical protein